jgi:type I restriction enzyme M protein
LNLKIPKLPVSVQQSMSQSINKSLNFRQKSKQLLEIAKIGVEKAIETDEETATAWINQQLESLGVKLIR